MCDDTVSHLRMILVVCTTEQNVKVRTTLIWSQVLPGVMGKEKFCLPIPKDTYQINYKTAWNGMGQNLIVQL